jgi:hypothetical protein
MAVAASGDGTTDADRVNADVIDNHLPAQQADHVLI